MALDPTDSEILRLLREDGRLSWRDLGAQVGLSANAAADRVRRLRQAGVITGFTALVDPDPCLALAFIAAFFTTISASPDFP